MNCCCCCCCCCCCRCRLCRWPCSLCLELLLGCAMPLLPRKFILLYPCERYVSQDTCEIRKVFSTVGSDDGAKSKTDVQLSASCVPPRPGFLFLHEQRAGEFRGLSLAPWLVHDVERMTTAIHFAFDLCRFCCYAAWVVEAANGL